MKIILLITIIGLIVFGVFFWTRDTSIKNSNQAKDVISNQAANIALPPKETLGVAEPTDLFPPLTQASSRVTKKGFGDYITPASSPIQPERFQGYHTGTDFEIFPDELNADVSVRAICTGQVLLKKESSGYGGVLVHNCLLEDETVTVLYGHLKLSSLDMEFDDQIDQGQLIGLLGDDKSTETDGERKHLHLAMRKGTDLDIRGYVSSQAGLDNWLDPCLYICQ